MFWRKQRSEPASPQQVAVDPLRVVFAYHEASKHDYQRYAAGPAELDWTRSPIRSGASRAQSSSRSSAASPATSARSTRRVSARDE